jgi:hypothetical protein
MNQVFRVSPESWEQTREHLEVLTQTSIRVVGLDGTISFIPKMHICGITIFDLRLVDETWAVDFFRP